MKKDEEDGRMKLVNNEREKRERERERERERVHT